MATPAVLDRDMYAKEKEQAMADAEQQQRGQTQSQPQHQQPTTKPSTPSAASSSTAVQSVSISDLIPSRDEVWVDYEENSNTQITFPILVKYISASVAQLLNQFMTGGRAGKRANPAKTREAYARYVFLDFRNLSNKGQPFENSLQNRIQLLANTGLLAFVIDTGNDATLFVDTGTEEDQKK